MRGVFGARPVRRGRERIAARGSVLVVSVVIMSALSVLVLTAANTILLAHRIQCAFEESVHSFYVAEAGLAHARALCPFLEPGAPDPDDDPEHTLPWGTWVPFGDGAYHLTYRFLQDGPSHLPLAAKGSGMLVEGSGRISPGRETRIKMLLHDPPSCEVVAWWQTRGD